MLGRNVKRKREYRIGGDSILDKLKVGTVAGHGDGIKVILTAMPLNWRDRGKRMPWKRNPQEYARITEDTAPGQPTGQIGISATRLLLILFSSSYRYTPINMHVAKASNYPRYQTFFFFLSMSLRLPYVIDISFFSIYLQERNGEKRKDESKVARRSKKKEGKYISFLYILEGKAKPRSNYSTRKRNRSLNFQAILMYFKRAIITTWRWNRNIIIYI